jgi:hypothetical protein
VATWPSDQHRPRPPPVSTLPGDRDGALTKNMMTWWMAGGFRREA